MDRNSATNWQLAQADIERIYRSLGRFAVEAEIADAIAFTETSPFPDISSLYTNVFAAE
jgi:hypothetical protein